MSGHPEDVAYNLITKAGDTLEAAAWMLLGMAEAVHETVPAAHDMTLPQAVALVLATLQRWPPSIWEGGTGHDYR